jgi:hypothetical protein
LGRKEMGREKKHPADAVKIHLTEPLQALDLRVRSPGEVVPRPAQEWQGAVSPLIPGAARKAAELREQAEAVQEELT